MFEAKKALLQFYINQIDVLCSELILNIIVTGMRYLQSVGERMFWNVQLVGQSTDQIRALHPGLEPKSKAPITVACSYYLYMGKPSII